MSLVGVAVRKSTKWILVAVKLGSTGLDRVDLWQISGHASSLPCVAWRIMNRHNLPLMPKNMEFEKALSVLSCLKQLAAIERVTVPYNKHILANNTVVTEFPRVLKSP